MEIGPLEYVVIGLQDDEDHQQATCDSCCRAALPGELWD